MLVLTNPKTLTAVLAAAPSATQPTIVVAYADVTTTSLTESSGEVTMTGTTPVTVMATPAASIRRVIKSVSFTNLDSAPATVTLFLNSIAAAKTTVASGTTVDLTTLTGLPVSPSQVATATIMGNNSGVSAVPFALSATATLTLLGIPGLQTSGISGNLTLLKTGVTARTVTFPDAAVLVTGSAAALTANRLPKGTATAGVEQDSQIADTVTGNVLTIAGTLTVPRTKTLQNTTATLAELETAETLTGAKTFSATANFSANLIVGTDPGGSDLLRVGGAITAGNSTDQARLIQSGTSTMLYLGASTSGGIKRLSYDRSTGSLSFIGGTVFLPSAQMALDNSGNLIIGIDPGGSDLLRVGGAIRTSLGLYSQGGILSSGTSVMSGAAGNLDVATANNGRFLVAGNGSNLLLASVTPTNSTYAPLTLQASVYYISTGSVIIGADPGGSELLRVGGSARIGASLTIGTGGTYTAGSIYSDASWGMLFRAKSAAPSSAEFRWSKSDDTELMRLDSNANLGVGVTPTASNGLVQLASGTTKASGIAFGDWNAYRAGGSDFFLTPAAATDGYFSVVRSTGERMALGAANSTGVVGTASNHQLSLITNGTTKAVLTTAGLFTVGGINAYSAITANGNASGTAGGAIISAQNNGTSIIALGNYSGVHGGAYDASSVIWGASDLSLGVGALVRFLRITPTAIGIFGNTPVAQATGFGTPTGVSRLINFPGATATLAQCSGAIADLITYLKSRGDLGA